MPLETFRQINFTPTELGEFEFFQAPCSVSECACKGKWEMPQNEDLEKFTIRDLLPGDSLSQIQRSTSTLLLLFNNELATWIGADSEDKISLVKRRLNTLVKYFVSLSLKVFDSLGIVDFIIDIPESGETPTLLLCRRSSELGRRA